MNAQSILRAIVMLALFGLVVLVGARVVGRVGAKAAASSPL